MQNGNGFWLGGVMLGIVAAGLFGGLVLANSAAIEPWTFDAVFGAAVLLLATVASYLLRRGWTLLRSTRPMPD